MKRCQRTVLDTKSNFKRSSKRQKVETKTDREVEESKLFVHQQTLSCALQSGCIPCIYKLFPSGFEGCPPNRRPESCYRASRVDSDPKCGGLYTCNQTILTVGDGDFSFSLSISRNFVSSADGKLIATSYESQTSVLNTYLDSSRTLDDLSRLKHVQILHNIDATKLNDEIQLNPYKSYFDIIVWNFPCKGIPAGKDGQVDDIEDNKAMLRSFFSSCKAFVKVCSDTSPGGEVHVTHKTIEPFSWWNIVALAKESGWFLRQCIVFDKYLYPGYTNRKALDKKSFPCNDALTYVFHQREEWKDSDMPEAAYIVQFDKSNVLKGLKEVQQLGI